MQWRRGASEGKGMRSSPGRANRLLVSTSRSLDEIIFAGNQKLSFLLYTYYAEKRPKGSHLAPSATIIEKGALQCSTSAIPRGALKSGLGTFSLLTHRPAISCASTAEN